MFKNGRTFSLTTSAWIWTSNRYRENISQSTLMSTRTTIPLATLTTQRTPLSLRFVTRSKEIFFFFKFHFVFIICQQQQSHNNSNVAAPSWGVRPRSPVPSRTVEDFPSLGSHNRRGGGRFNNIRSVQRDVNNPWNTSSSSSDSNPFSQNRHDSDDTSFRGKFVVFFFRLKFCRLFRLLSLQLIWIRRIRVVWVVAVLCFVMSRGSDVVAVRSSN